MAGDYWPLRIDAHDRPLVLDQTLLPQEERYLEIRDVATLCEAIRSLRVRGAPLLGLCGASGMALAAAERGTSDTALEAAAAEIESTRPTAVDLGAAVRKALELALNAPEHARQELLRENAHGMLERQADTDRAIGRHGAALFEPGTAVLTHCNTGALATGGAGTALAVVDEGWRQGRIVRCYATETRPLLQGARLTMWELGKLGIPATLLPDTATAALITGGNVGAVVTGADRVAANGDTANKIGTLGLALAAQHAGVPFYIAAPGTTFDADCVDGLCIPIEYRGADEVGGYSGTRWAPADVDAYNPAFDVTPAGLIAGYITERGVFRAGTREFVQAFTSEQRTSPVD